MNFPHEASRTLEGLHNYLYLWLQLGIQDALAKAKIISAKLRPSGGAAVGLIKDQIVWWRAWQGAIRCRDALIPEGWLPVSCAGEMRDTKR